MTSGNHDFIVFTDLDGTLLDHHSYSFDAARPTLEKLAQNQIPVIPVTSKTAAELNPLRQQLELDTPFIVENGAAIYIPCNYFRKVPTDLDNSASHGIKSTDGAADQRFLVKSFAPDREFWISFAQHELAEFSHCFTSFSELGDQGVSQATGLPIAAAKLANDRAFSDPLLWQGSDKDKDALKQLLAKKDITLLEGGRFLHLTTGYDKGNALAWLKHCYQEDSGSDSMVSLALGDGQNDVAMLERADIALLIRSPVNALPAISRTRDVYASQLFGPEGWAELIQHHLLKKL